MRRLETSERVFDRDATNDLALVCTAALITRQTRVSTRVSEGRCGGKRINVPPLEFEMIYGRRVGLRDHHASLEVG